MTRSLKTLAIAGIGAAAMLAPVACAQESGSDLGGLPRVDNRPLEAIDGVTSHYSSVELADGSKLRTIITTPDGASEPLHPLSCLPNGFPAAPLNIGKAAAHAKFLRPSQEKAACHSCVLSARPTAIPLVLPAMSSTTTPRLPTTWKPSMTLLKDPRLNAEKVYINGSSLGSTTAPLVALALQERGYDIAGVAVQGGGAETYYERMLHF